MVFVPSVDSRKQRASFFTRFENSIGAINIHIACSNPTKFGHKMTSRVSSSLNDMESFQRSMIAFVRTRFQLYQHSANATAPLLKRFDQQFTKQKRPIQYLASNQLCRHGGASQFPGYWIKPIQCYNAIEAIAIIPPPPKKKNNNPKNRFNFSATLIAPTWSNSPAPPPTARVVSYRHTFHGLTDWLIILRTWAKSAANFILPASPNGRKRLACRTNRSRQRMATSRNLNSPPSAT